MTSELITATGQFDTDASTGSTVSFRPLQATLEGQYGFDAHVKFHFFSLAAGFTPPAELRIEEFYVRSSLLYDDSIGGGSELLYKDTDLQWVDFLASYDQAAAELGGLSKLSCRVQFGWEMYLVYRNNQGGAGAQWNPVFNIKLFD